jgi:hypothetical protein
MTTIFMTYDDSLTGPGAADEVALAEQLIARLEQSGERGSS